MEPKTEMYNCRAVAIKRRLIFYAEKKGWNTMDTTKTNKIDSAMTTLYNQDDVDSIVAGAVERAILQYENRRSNLDNRIQQSEDAIPLLEGAEKMNHRRKLTINGTTQWRTFDSLQDLVDMVTDAVKAEYDVSKRRSQIRVQEYMLDWYHTYKEPQLDKGTAVNYECMMKKHILPAIGDKLICDVTVADVQRIMSKLKSASRAKQVKSIINLVIEAAIADELYHHPNPCKDKRITMPTAVKKREALQNDDLSKLIAFLPSLPEEYAKILVMLIMTGCRRGEALGARWEDIDWAHKTIHLQRVVRFRSNRPEVSEKMKTKAANRVVSLWDEFIPYLGAKKESGFIINCDDEPLTERMYRNRWDAIMKLLKEAGLEERFTAHQLRHTYATVAANSGQIPPKVLQGMLGHANFQTTMNIYAGLDAEKVRESSQNLAGQYTKIQTKSCRKVVARKTPKTPATQGF